MKIARFTSGKNTIELPGLRIFMVLTAMLIAGFFGCSPVPRHKTLSFFFDGVPEPGANGAIAGNDSSVRKDSSGTNTLLARAAKTEVYYHSPYREKQCSSCHDQGTMGKFVQPQPMLCYQCHEDFGTKYKVLHGPVGGGYCSGCHEPHTAKNSKLLKREGQQLCLFCHNADQVLGNEVHKDIADAACTECHDPHGGPDRTFLK
jgi:predicted CXXCH cytochrome family protein